MAVGNIYKPRYFFRNRSQSKIYLYKDGYLRRFYERRGRRAKRGGLFRRYVLVAKNRKWTIARRFMRPMRRSAGIRVKRSRSTIHGRPLKRLYKNAFSHKERLRHFYGKNKEQAFRAFFNSYKRLQGTTSSSFFSLLESRLDRTLYRRRLFPTIYGCRQFINYHGIFINNTTETSSRYRVKMGDTLSLPMYAWRSLYWDLYCRVYYRRWGRYISSRRFYSRFQKKIFKARRYFLRNIDKGYYFNENKNAVSSAHKKKPTENKLWLNFLSPFSVTKSFQFFKPYKPNYHTKNASGVQTDVRKQFNSFQYPTTRRGFFLLRSASPHAEHFSAKSKKRALHKKRTRYTLRRRAIWRLKRKAHIMKTLGLNKTDKASQLNRSLISNSASLSRAKDVKNKMSTPINSKKKNILFKKSKYAYNSRKRIFGISYYLKKKHERLSRKKTHKKISASNLYLKNTFQDIYSKNQRFASRIYTKSRARRLFRRSFFSSVRFIKLFFDATNPTNDSSNFVIKKSKINSERGLRNELQTSVFNRTDASRPPLQQRYLRFIKEVPRIHNRQLLSAHFQHFIKLRGTEDCEREAAFLKRKKSGFDFSKESTTLFHRKRSKLASYFFSRKLRKKVFPFFSELRKNSFVANATKMESNSTFTNDSIYSNKSKISLTHGYHKRNQKRRKSVLPLPIYQRSIFSAPRLRKSIFLKLLKLKKRKNFLKQQKIKSNYKSNGKAIGLNKMQGFFKKKRK